mmetsp:Transcript_21784/g.29981  ORF Transcript_21784/g.29981 Transcript_21784/m.29981 type:complete len:206 (-) Transcript_21784:38-655(-)|eukprot:CAMPEP_0201487394 /NCGR_PEP_ID=MMETSP0151_2-20130828/12787_1 /ASSEMBLY_ACC=CAM_ASM_000257 /TAXON_ID=200890 /ORGANISM="Paramoeba atlantica, Strain 621/1 / CCAP 1560/9" /LENGTH=205 /DNA_ID=CAMNT_0047872411 /DNA_START=62 /DNA_END=679 /DNA_ORIENTATION=+
MAKEKNPDAGPDFVKMIFIIAIFKSIGFGIAYYIFQSGATDRALGKTELLGDLGWIYLAVWVLTITQPIMFFFSQGARETIGFPRPDMHLLKVVNDWRSPNAKATGYAVLDNEGTNGKFNRSSRAVYNYLEYLPVLLVNSIVAGFVFPYPIFILSLITFAGRTFYSLGYTASFKARIPGFLVSTFAQNTLEGLTLLSGLLALHFI